MALSKKTRDYITIWNTGVGFVYIVNSFTTLLQIILLLQMQAEFNKAYGGSSAVASSHSAGLSGEQIFAIFLIVDIFVAGISNFFYSRKYISGDNPKSKLGYTATISLIIANIYMLYTFGKKIIDTATASSSLSRTGTSSVISDAYFGSQFSWVMWLVTIIIVFNAVAAVLAFFFMLKSDRYDDDDDDDDKSWKSKPLGKFYADVPKHATGGSGSAGPKTEPATDAAKDAKDEKKEPLLDLHGNPIVDEPKKTEEPAAAAAAVQAGDKEEPTLDLHGNVMVEKPVLAVESAEPASMEAAPAAEQAPAAEPAPKAEPAPAEDASLPTNDDLGTELTV